MFAKVNQVVECGSVTSVETVVSGPETHAGGSYYRVNFYGRVKNVVEEDLEAFVSERDIETLREAGTFGDQVAFARGHIWR